MTKEIIDILSKYKSENWCQDIITNIDDDIQNVTDQLKYMQKELSHKLYKINLSNKPEDDRISDDILNDIKVIKQLKEYFKELNKSLANMVEKDKRIIFENKINLFVISDDLCPICNVKLQPVSIRYKRIINEHIQDNIVNGCYCTCCNRSFIMQDQINNSDIKFNDSNIILNYQYLERSRESLITLQDVIVLSNIKSCTTKEHNIRDMIAQIPVFDIDGNVRIININVSYCGQCNKYIMLKNDFKNINGIIACQVIDQTRKNDKNDIDDIEIKQYESVLYKYGYNVKTKDNLSDKQRHLILASVVESGILTRGQISSHLDILIERGSKIEKWKLATQKWKQDRSFIMKYNTHSLPSILLNRVILKYSQMTLNI